MHEDAEAAAYLCRSDCVLVWLARHIHHTKDFNLVQAQQDCPPCLVCILGFVIIFKNRSNSCVCMLSCYWRLAEAIMRQVHLHVRCTKLQNGASLHVTMVCAWAHMLTCSTKRQCSRCGLLDWPASSAVTFVPAGSFVIMWQCQWHYVACRTGLG